MCHIHYRTDIVHFYLDEMESTKWIFLCTESVRASVEMSEMVVIEKN